MHFLKACDLVRSIIKLTTCPFYKLVFLSSVRAITNIPGCFFRFTFHPLSGGCPLSALLRPSDEVTDVPSKLACSLFRDGGRLIFHCAHRAKVGSSGLSRLSGLSGWSDRKFIQKNQIDQPTGQMRQTSFGFSFGAGNSYRSSRPTNPHGASCGSNGADPASEPLSLNTCQPPLPKFSVPMYPPALLLERRLGAQF